MSQASKSERRLHPNDSAGGEAGESRFRAAGRTPLVNLGLFLLLSALLALLVGTPPRSPAVVYREGEVAREDVKAAADFLLIDQQATEKRRAEAEAAAPAVYVLNPHALREALAGLDQTLEALDVPQGGPEGPLPFPFTQVREGLSSHWEVPVGEAAVRELLSPGGRRDLRERVWAALQPQYLRGVVANRRLLATEGRRGVVVRNAATGDEAPLDDPSNAVDFDEARQALATSDPGDPEGFARRVAATLLRPNLTYDGEETTARKAAAVEAVKPVLFQILQGEMLVREGDRVTAEQSRRLREHARIAEPGGGWRARLGLFVLAALALYSVYRYGRANVKKFRCSEKDLVFLAGLLALMIALERGGMLVLGAVAATIPEAAQTALTYALPVGAAAIVVRVVLNSETAVLFGLPYFALAALPFGQSISSFFCFAIGGLVGAHWAARACHRMDFLLAGFWTGVSQAGVALAFGLLDGGVPLTALPWWLGAAFFGGLVGGVVALCLIPLAEWLFGYTTEMRLLELASLDHPLLRGLMLRAPGTYHHSIVTGSLVKAAAEAIGARALLATVAAYYHDVGKLSKPAYYIENQSDGRNRHDGLAPSMSGLILASHVKEGVELARRHRLGREIVDIVAQHHGTSPMRYFYDKARQSAKSGVESVDEASFRYPGPKPQSREAALVLLADAVEAASRTLREPRPARIQGLVQNIINRTFADGQLDDCPLTLKDLHEIARSFTRILGAIYHQRIDYPLSAQKERTPDGDLDSQRLPGDRGGRGAAAESRGEGLRRLGL